MGRQAIIMAMMASDRPIGSQPMPVEKRPQEKFPKIEEPLNPVRGSKKVSHGLEDRGSSQIRLSIIAYEDSFR